jgi:hypothetical protein
LTDTLPPFDSLLSNHLSDRPELSGEKKKSYLQGLEAIATRHSTVPTLPSTRIDHFPELASQGDKHARGGSVYNETSVQGSLRESFSHTYSPVNYQAVTEGVHPGSMPGCAQFQPITGESTDQHQGDIGLFDGNPITPSAVDPSLAVYSDDTFAWPLSCAGQNIVGVEESRFPNSQDDIQPDQPHSITPVHLIFSSLADAHLSDDIMNRKFTLQEILMAGLRDLSKRGKQPMNSTLSLSKDAENEARLIPTASCDSDDCRLPDIRINTIQLTTMSFVAACMSNAAMLVLSPAELMNKKSQSPFYQAQISHEVAQTTYTRKFVHLKPQLRPSTTQFVHPHHPYLDILPFPAFRNCAIQLLQVQPRPFDPEELCRDLQNDGLICWGSTVRDGGDLTGSGAPWDIRSWEMQPWFHKKWWLLIDGVDGEMSQQTRWWSEVSGGRSS